MDTKYSNAAWERGLFEIIPMQLWKQIARQEANANGLVHLIFKKGNSKTSFEPIEWEFLESLTPETKTPYEKEDDYICVCVDTNKRCVDIELPFCSQDGATGLLSVCVEYKISDPALAVRMIRGLVEEIKNRYQKSINNFTMLNDLSICVPEALKSEMLKQEFKDIGVIIIYIANPEITNIVKPENRYLEKEVQGFLDTVDQLKSQAVYLMQDLQYRINDFKSQLTARDKKMQELETKATEVENELYATQEIKLALENKTRELNSEAEQQMSQITELSGQLQEYKTEIQRGQTALKESSDQLKIVNERLNILGFELEKTRAEGQRSKSLINMLLIILALLFVALLVLGSGAIRVR